MKMSKKLPVLMYHRVTENGASDPLTVTLQDIEKQFLHLKNNNYCTISLSELMDTINHRIPLPTKPVLLTFDDGYKDNFTALYPLLKKYNYKANIFLVSEFINTVNPSGEYLTTKDITLMDTDLVQFALHTVNHKSYKNISLDEIDNDIKDCKQQLSDLGISYQPCLAYTFGSYPKKDIQKRNALFALLKKHSIQLAFKIGNRINSLPVKNKFLIERIDVRGNESFLKFKLGLRFGKKIFPF